MLCKLCQLNQDINWIQKSDSFNPDLYYLTVLGGMDILL